MYPYIVPQSITIWQAAAPANSQLFMLVGVAVLVPLILGYTAWAYWVFRGKVQSRERLSLMPDQPNRGRWRNGCCGSPALWLGGVGTVAIVA